MGPDRRRAGCLVPVVAVVLHLIFLSSVFDIHFRSPVVLVAKSHRPDYIGVGQPAPARRLVLFVADGLRAESLFSEAMGETTPFLKGVAEKRGVWGVSHTRVPTESRPGHVALIAGMHEDPSAITRGWKENPADFDTVFNNSRKTWAWGSPDIVPMFLHDDGKGTPTGGPTPRSRAAVVVGDTYSREMEDFSARGDPAQLDSWVFRKVRAFFDRAKRSEEKGEDSADDDDGPDLRSQLRQDRLVFFLHLLGLDTSGHTVKPGSEAFRHNLAVVDRGVREVYELVEAYFKGDRRTAYLFTSDHGMTDWGSHGAGTDHETETPILAWGAGLKVAGDSKEPISRAAVHSAGNAARRDVNQTDLAPLMSALLGTGMPRNSVGRLPKGYLDMHPQLVLRAAVANALQLHELFRAHADSLSGAFFFRPFAGLDYDTSASSLVSRIARWENSSSRHYDLALREVDRFSDLCLQGVDYYLKYHRPTLYCATTLGYVGFILYLVFRIALTYTPCFGEEEEDEDNLRGEAVAKGVAAVLASAAVAFVILQRHPAHFVVYLVSPVLVWYLLAADVVRSKFVAAAAAASFTSSEGLCEALKIFGLSLLVVESMVVAFTDRRFLIPGLAAVAAWQLSRASGGRFKRSPPAWFKGLWGLSCAILGAFTFRPSVGKEKNAYLVLAAGALSLGLAVLARSALTKRSQTSRQKTGCDLGTAGFVGNCVLLAAGAACVLSCTVPDLVDLSHCLGWLVVVASVPLALASTASFRIDRLLSVSVALQAMYLLLAIHYEGLFMLCLFVTLTLWLLMEEAHAVQEDLRLVNDKKDHRPASSSSLLSDLQSALAEASASASAAPARSLMRPAADVPCALTFLFFSVASLFGTGNIASLNSFDVRSIQTLVSTFDPFLMGSLLLAKLLIPFTAVACFACAVQKVAGTPTDLVLLLVLLFSDLMSLQFFFQVSDSGSWQEIGTSLSHFVIAESIVLFQLLLLVSARFLLTFQCPRSLPGWKTGSQSSAKRD